MMKQHTAFAVLMLLPIARAAHADVENGSFEVYAKPTSSWSVPGQVDLAVPAGDTNITGWTVINGNIDFIHSSLASNGLRWLDLNGDPGSGGVEQSFATLPGTPYTVSFDMSGNPDPNFSDPTLKTMRVSAAGQFGDFSYDTAVEGNSLANLKWKHRELAFTATSTTTTLQIFSTTAVSFRGPLLDNVSVAVVPEPSSMLLVVAGLCICVGPGLVRRSWRVQG